MYYFAYSISHGLPSPLVEQLTSLTLTVVAVSIVAHDISVTPLITSYSRTVKSREQ